MSSTAKNFILFDDQTWSEIIPLTFTKPVAAIRIGILTIKEKWDLMLGLECSYLTQTYLSEKYKLKTGGENVFINGSITPNNLLVKEITDLKPGNALAFDETVIACNMGKDIPQDFTEFLKDTFQKKKVISEIFKISHSWDIFLNNGNELTADFKLITAGRKSTPISLTNRVIKPENIFIEEGAIVECAILNASKGPIYIGREAEVMEGSMIRGPFALCEHSILKMGAKIYGPTTIGPNSKIGGEVNNTVFFSFSNKSHDGYIGNSVVGEWCNLGADTNVSNLKNNYATVKVWSYTKETFIDTQLQFCGLIMGDHSKTGINTMLNTGTVMGVNANIFGDGFPRTFIPSFSWGGADGFTTYSLNKAFETMEIVMQRKNINLDDTEKRIIEHIFNTTTKFRKK